MEKTQVFLREEQRDALREIAARTGQRQSALIRHGVDLVIAEIQSKTAEWRVALDGVKGIWADREDLDRYSEQFRERFSSRFRKNN